MLSGVLWKYSDGRSKNISYNLKVAQWGNIFSFWVKIKLNKSNTRQQSRDENLRSYLRFRKWHGVSCSYRRRRQTLTRRSLNDRNFKAGGNLNMDADWWQSWDS